MEAKQQHSQPEVATKGEPKAVAKQEPNQNYFDVAQGVMIDNENTKGTPQQDDVTASANEKKGEVNADVEANFETKGPVPTFSVPNALEGVRWPSDIMPEPLPPLQHRAAGVNDPSLPGAYALGGIGGTVAPVVTGSSTNSGPAPPQDDLTGLAVANPVDDECAIPRAEPATNSTRRQKTPEEKDAWTQQIALSVCVVVLLVAAVVVAVVVSRKDDPIEVGASSPATNMIPVSNETVAPETPSSPLASFLETLPNSTVANIQIYNTPQWLAYDWLLNYPNVTNLEEWRKTQLFALASFYYAMEGPHWEKTIKENFLIYDQYDHDKPEECYWFSSLFGNWENENGTYSEASEKISWMKPCNEKGEFEKLWFARLELTNYTVTLPPEIALLSKLDDVLFAYSDFKGNLDNFLPSELYEMESLTSLMFHVNQLTGTIPTELGLITSLSSLSIHTNPLGGTIPTEFGQLTNLKKLWLGDHGLHGGIPSELAQLTKMTDLELYGCGLTGTVPSWLGLMPNMTLLNIHNNTLTGPIPTELGVLGILYNLTLRDNQLTGTIPEWLGFMESMWTLELQVNDFNGTIPSELGLLTKLTKLDLSYLPQLSGSIPTEFGLLASYELAGLKLVGSSGLSGTVPEELCYLQNGSCLLFDWWWGMNRSCFLEFDCTDLCGCSCTCAE